MATRLPSLRRPPIAFAHRGARAHAPENTIEAFALALRLGATGIETDAWITADGEIVLDHDGRLGWFVFSRPYRSLARDGLPGHVPTLAQLYEECGTDYELSIDVKDPSAVAETIAVATRYGAVERLWLCCDDLDTVASWRSIGEEVRLVNSVRLSDISEGPERRAATLAETGIDALNMREPDWNGGLAALCHRFDLLAFAWDAQHERQLDRLLDLGIDAVYSDHVDRMADSFARFGLA